MEGPGKPTEAGGHACQHWGKEIHPLQGWGPSSEVMRQGIGGCPLLLLTPITPDPSSGSPEPFPRLLGELVISLESEALNVKSAAFLISHTCWPDSALSTSKALEGAPLPLCRKRVCFYISGS